MIMKNIIYIFFSIIFILSAWSDGSDSNEGKTGDHVWKGQTDTLEKAKAAEGVTQDSTDEQRKLIEEQIQ